MLICVLICTERWRGRPGHSTTFRTCLFGSEHSSQNTREAKHFTGFHILPLGGNESTCVFDDLCGDVSLWGAFGRPGEFTSDLSVLKDLGALQNDTIQSEIQGGIAYGEPVTAWYQNNPELISSPWDPRMICAYVGRALDRRGCIRRGGVHRM